MSRGGVLTLSAVLVGAAILLGGWLAASSPEVPSASAAAVALHDCPDCVAAHPGADPAGGAARSARVSLLDTTGFPERWHCGAWPASLGWLHIASDVLTWLAYLAIPGLLLVFLRRRPSIAHSRVLWLSAAFILSCGTTHLLDAAMFWWPAYRLLGVAKLCTALISRVTVVSLAPLLGRLVQLRSPRELEGEVEARTRELALSETRERATFERAAVGIAHVGLDGSWLKVNPRMCQILGYDAEELLRIDFQRVTHPLDLDADLDQVEAVLEGRISTYSMEKRYIRKDGSTVWANLTVSLVRGADGEPVHFVSIVDDITETRHMRQVLQDAHDELEVQVSERTAELRRSNEELERFAYVASHDLQEPLRTVSSFVQLLERRLGDDLDEESREYIGFAVDGTARMKALIQDLLEYSRVGAGETDRADVDLGLVVQDAMAYLHASLEESGAAVRVGALPAVHGDRRQLRRLFQNLIDNAAKHGSADGPPTIDIEGARVGDRCRITVSDRGPGVPEEDRERIFVIFQQLPGPGGTRGTGMGLAIAKKIVEWHGGSLTVGPRADGAGACFTFDLAASAPVEVGP